MGRKKYRIADDELKEANASYESTKAEYENLERAMESIEEEIKLLKRIEGLEGVISAQMIYAYHSTEKKMLKEATQCYEEIMKLPLTPKTGQMVAPYLIATKQYDKALDYIRETKRMLAESEDTLKSFYISYVLKYEEDIYKEMGRYKEALYVADNIKNITDSITKREREHEAQEMATIYNSIASIEPESIGRWFEFSHPSQADKHETVRILTGEAPFDKGVFFFAF